MILLNRKKQYSGSIVKSIIFLIGSYGYYLIYYVSFNEISDINVFKYPKIIFIVYFIIIPGIVNTILIIGSIFF